MLKGLGQFASLLKNAQAMQGRMQEMQDALRRLTVTGVAGGGMVSVEMNGAQQVVACRIDPTAISAGDREMLEDLVVAATNQALDKVKQATASEMEKLAGNIDLSGIGSMLSQLGQGGAGGQS